ncbi:MAG: neutral/alkaline non-lysosomal ceramidase N-terminal domain-containing protein [Smithellaceae bacterium]|nr:neutral/alkaline non-lysosomal ceramidase N-terminal domain-containing protein [Smithellaceae bacterium]
MKNLLRFFLATFVACLFLSGCADKEYTTVVDPTTPGPETSADAIKVGVGKADVTGPSAILAFMGMSDPTQQGKGIGMRQFARAFVFVQGKTKIAYVTCDIGMIFQGVKQAVIERLQSEVDSGWSEENVWLQGTHTHAGPAGSSHYWKYNLAPIGFSQECFDAQVNGIVAAIKDAIADAQQDSGEELSLTTGDLYQCGWNRSPRSYENNPVLEKAHYGEDLAGVDQEGGFESSEETSDFGKYVDGINEHVHLNDGQVRGTGYVNGKRWNNTNKKMTLLRIGDKAMVNWYALHPTSLGSYWRYISGDNKGYAELLWERKFPGMVGAFAQANCGDVSGNIKFGMPAKSDVNADWPHCKEMGQRQFDKALELYTHGKKEKLGRVIDYRHRYIDFSRVVSDSPQKYYNRISDDPNTPWHTVAAATGISTLGASSEDSNTPLIIFREGTTTDNIFTHMAGMDSLGSYGIGPLIDLMSVLELTSSLETIYPGVLSFLPAALDPAYLAGQDPKPIILPDGLGVFPYTDTKTGETSLSPFSPEVLPLQLIRMGELIIVAIPFETTTMAGRRIENVIKTVFNGDKDGDGYGDEDGPIKHVVVAQCSNAYAGYLVTAEEYQLQFYEGGSCHFGPNALKAVQQEIGKLAWEMKTGSHPLHAADPVPRNLNGTAIAQLYPAGVQTPPYDLVPPGQSFGDIVTAPHEEVLDKGKTTDVGTTYLKLQILGALPNRNLMTGSTYITVTTPNGRTYNDSDPETRFQWGYASDMAFPMTSLGTGVSVITIWFDTAGQAASGNYVFTYTAQAKTASGMEWIRKSYTFDPSDPEKQVTVADLP